MSQKTINQLVKAIESMPKKGKPSRKQRKQKRRVTSQALTLPRAPNFVPTIADYIADRRIGLDQIQVATMLSAKSVSDAVYTTRFTRTFASGVLGEMILINPSLIFLDLIHGDQMSTAPTFQPYTMAPVLAQTFTQTTADPFDITDITQIPLNNQFTTFTGTAPNTRSANGTGYFLGVAGEISIMEDSSVFNEGGRLTFVDGSQGMGLLAWRYATPNDSDTGAHFLPSVNMLQQPQLSYQVPLTRSKKAFRFGMTLPHQVEIRDIPERAASTKFDTSTGAVTDVDVNRDIWPDAPLDFADMGYTVGLVVQPSNAQQTVTYEISFRALTHYYPPDSTNGVTSNVLSRPDNTVVPVNHALCEKTANGNAKISISQQAGNPIAIALHPIKLGLARGFQNSTASFASSIEKRLERGAEQFAGKAGRAVVHYADKALMRIPEALGRAGLGLLRWL